MSDNSKIVSIVLAMVALCTFLAPADNTIKVITVNGSINASEMGTTLVHEHILVDWIGADSTGYHRWDRDEVVERVLPFVMEAKERGVDTIIECTGRYLGHDPYVVAELSRQSGVQFLTNTGYYGAAENQFIPRQAYDETSEEIADRWIDEFENGFEDSGIRPGIMKISVAQEQSLSELHQKIVRAAVRTHLETGMTIVSHTVGDIPAFEQIELLKNEGVSPSAWVWTHAQSGSLEANIRAAGEGAWLSLDGINQSAPAEPGENGSIKWFADRIRQLKDAGHLDKILLSHDAGWYTVGEPDGGDFRGYTDIFDHLIPELKENGFSEAEVHQMTVVNPQNAYGIRVRRSS
jgi:phosphotriesterase-related protein